MRASPERKLEMAMRRKRQRERIPDNDGRIVYFSKNSLPEYRKPHVLKEFRK